MQVSVLNFTFSITIAFSGSEIDLCGECMFCFPILDRVMTVSLKLTKRQRAISWRTSRGLNWEKYKLNRYIVLQNHLVSMDNGPWEKNNNYLSSHEFFLGKNK